MKIKMLLVSIVIVLLHLNLTAQPVDQAALDKSIKNGNTEVINAITKNSSDITTAIKSAKLNNTPVQPLKADPTTSIIISFLPIVFFLLIVLVLLIKSKRNDITLREILLDKDLQVTIKKEEAKVDIANAKVNESISKAITARAEAAQAAGVAPLAADTLPPNPDTKKPNSDVGDDAGSTPMPEQQSTSRLLALISGVTSVALAACIATFYMYRWSLGDNPDIGHLSTVLYGLGLGVIPYGFNKVASALR